ncbi:hypothetical protein KBC40_01220 [Patescibacteria group bacterium]|nr:hypothetical protein [Patescibacteria group bacterium]
MSEKILEFTAKDNKAEGETNNTEQGIVYPPEIKAKLDLAMDKITKTEKGSAEELIALQAYQEEITPLTKAREEKEAKEALVDFQGEQIHKFELEALKDLIVQINKGFAQQRIINKDFEAEDISLDDLEITIEDNKVVGVKFTSTILVGDISGPIEALINLRTISLYSLSSAKGLTLPSTVNGDLYLSSLKSAKGLTLPSTVNGDLGLSRLSSAEGLILPTTVNGGLSLSNLRSAKGLILPTTLNGDLYLNSLSSDQRNELRKKHPSFKIQPLD